MSLKKMILFEPRKADFFSSIRKMTCFECRRIRRLVLHHGRAHRLAKRELLLPLCAPLCALLCAHSLTCPQVRVTLRVRVYAGHTPVLSAKACCPP